MFYIAPAKNKIYGEYYPATIKKQNPDTASRAFQLIDYIKQNSDVQVVCPYERLIREKEKGELLYYKNDTHWNELGSYIGYQELCRVLGIEPMEVSEYEVVKKEVGDQTNLFPEGTHKDYETTYRIPKIEQSYSQTQIADGLNNNKTIVTKNKGKNLNAVVFRDSFSNAWIRYISNSFANVTYFWRQFIQNSDYELLSQSDIVILEICERNLPSLAVLHFPTFD